MGVREAVKAARNRGDDVSPWQDAGGLAVASLKAAPSWDTRLSLRHGGCSSDYKDDFCVQCEMAETCF